MNILRIISNFFKKSSQKSLQKIYVAPEDFSNQEFYEPEDQDSINSRESYYIFQEEPRDLSVHGEKIDKASPSAGQILSLTMDQDNESLKSVLSSTGSIDEDCELSLTVSALCFKDKDINLSKAIFSKINVPNLIEEQSYQILHGIINNSSNEPGKVDESSIELLRFAIEDLKINAGAIHQEYLDNGEEVLKDALAVALEKPYQKNDDYLGKKETESFIRILLSTKQVKGLEDESLVQEILEKVQNGDLRDQRLGASYRFSQISESKANSSVSSPIQANQVLPISLGQSIG